MATKRVKKRTKHKAEERRIYVIVPHTVQVPGPRGSKEVLTKHMEPGRLMAQCAHVVTRVRLDIQGPPEPITTIVLSARNSRELRKLHNELYRYTPVFAFHDSNPDFYGSEFKPMTAIATVPVTKSQIDEVIGHLELYS